ncbi:amidohydrolase family protein [soil metagenome]
MLLSNARIGDTIVDVRIEGDAIAAVGSLAGSGIDLEGRWIVPGLWDNHVHFTQWALNRQRLDLGAATSARHVAALVREAIGSSDAVPFVGIGFRDGLWPDAPNLPDLDAVSGGRPVVLASGDLHSVWLNSAALARYGHAGHATGLLREADAFRITALVAQLPVELTDGYAAEAALAAAARGVVGIVDYEMTWNLDVWQRRRSQGDHTIRVEFGIYSNDLERAIELGLFTGQQVGELLTVGRFKVLTDGSLNTRTAYCFDPYPGTDDHGVLTVAPQQLVPLMRRAAEAGIEPAVHAIGDHATALALDAFAKIGHRGSIEHAQLVACDDFARFAALGVIASVQPEHAMDDRDVADRYWAGRTDRTIALRSLADAGATLAFGSDAPVAPLDPWITADAAITRSRDGREPWHVEQAVSVAEAIAASTRSRIAWGEPADLVVLDADPYTSPLREMPVHATMVAGRWTHRTTGE